MNVLKSLVIEFKALVQASYFYGYYYQICWTNISDLTLEIKSRYYTCVIKKAQNNSSVKILLKVCPYYNEDGICNHHDQCTRLHICQKFILGKCPEGPSQMLEPEEGASSVGCPLTHSLTSPHSLRLLRNFGVGCTTDSLPDVYCQILAPKKPKKASKDK